MNDMNSFSKYIKGLFSGLKSLLVGMRTSIKVFFQPKVTEQYPENRHTTLHIPERHRAKLFMYHDDKNQHRCVACNLCEMSCPNGTIKITSELQEDENGKKRKVLVKYEYNLGSCIFCQLCVNACPHNAIEFNNDFESAVYEKDKLLLTLNREGSTLAKKH